MSVESYREGYQDALNDLAAGRARILSQRWHLKDRNRDNDYNKGYSDGENGRVSNYPAKKDDTRKKRWWQF